jgi:hypothetical protein
MDRLNAIAVAVPLAAAGLACGYALLSRDPPAHPPMDVVEHCRRAAELLYDVTWAAACLRTDDDSADCTLPDAQAAKINGILDGEEARCMASEMHARADR